MKITLSWYIRSFQLPYVHRTHRKSDPMHINWHPMLQFNSNRVLAISIRVSQKLRRLAPAPLESEWLSRQRSVRWERELARHRAVYGFTAYACLAHWFSCSAASQVFEKKIWREQVMKKYLKMKKVPENWPDWNTQRWENGSRLTLGSPGTVVVRQNRTNSEQHSVNDLAPR